MTNNPKWHKTHIAGVRYREHPDRKHQGKPDRYFTIRYKKNNKLIGEAAGWASHGMNTQKANLLRAEIVQNIREGIRPQSLREKREMEAETEAEEAKKAEQKKQDQYTFGEAAEAFINWGKDNKKSWKDDEGRYLNYIKPVLKKTPLKDVSPLQIERIKSIMKKNRLSDKTIHHAFTFIRAVFLKHISWGLYQGPIPTKNVKFPKLDNNRTRFLSHDEAKLLLDELKKKSMSTYYQSIFSLFCGLRFSEIAKLKWSDIDLTHKIIHVRDAKSGKSREAYMTKPIEATIIHLNEQHNYQNGDLIFPDKKGKVRPHIPNTFYRVVDKIGFNHSINDRRRKVCFHTLRHTFGSWLALHGTSLYEIKELMGHSDIKMTERYAHLMPSVKRNAVNKIAEAFNNQRDKSDLIELTKEY